jgi:hypothetical protein
MERRPKVAAAIVARNPPASANMPMAPA